MDATVTIVNYNTVAKLRDCLQSIRETTQGMALETIVVDNGSKDASVEMVRTEFPEVRLVATGENLGFGRGHNRAMALGTGRYFIVLNPDTIVEPHTFRRLVTFMDETPGAGACGPTVKDATGALAHSGHKDFTLLSVAANAFNLRAVLPSDAVLRRLFGTWLGRVHSAYHPHDTLREVDWIDGACLVVRRAAYAETGGFDERIFLNGEDFDWCLRLRRAGWKVFHVPEARLQHLMHQSKDQVYVPSYVAYYWALIYLFNKHHGPVAGFMVRGILMLAFSIRFVLARLRSLGHDRARAMRDAEACLGVLRTAVAYDPSDARRGAFPRRPDAATAR